jgi:hypothetical protein
LQAASEVEETLKRLQSHKGVEAILIVNHDGIPLRSTMTVEQTKKYAEYMSSVRLNRRPLLQLLQPTHHDSVARFTFSRVALFVGAALHHRQVCGQAGRRNGEPTMIAPQKNRPGLCSAPARHWFFVFSVNFRTI